MSDIGKTAREFYKTIESAAEKKQKGGYDTQATVRRIEDDVCWVHIPGGVSETPARLTIAAKVGDVVQVRVANGRAFLVGNASAPPTDNTEAIKALTMAGSAAQAAGIAWQKAEEATADAERAHEAAMSAQDDAERAQASADAAQTSADNAQTSATTANTAANNALSGLSMVESVVDVVNWFARHKTPSTDTTVDPTKTYYSYDATTGALTKLDPEGTEDPSALGWYELGDAISQYVATHVATTNDGLYVLAETNGWRVLVSSGGGNYPAGVYLIDPSGNVAQQTTVGGVAFNTGKPVTIGDGTAYIRFDGNGNITIIGANLTVGGEENIDGILTIKDEDGDTAGTIGVGGFKFGDWNIRRAELFYEETRTNSTTEEYYSFGLGAPGSQKMFGALCGWYYKKVGGAYEIPLQQTFRLDYKGEMYLQGYRVLTSNSSASDIRLKTNIKDTEADGLTAINKIRLKQFDWIKRTEHERTHNPIGMIADEIEEIDPCLVSGGGYCDNGDPNYKYINTLQLTSYLVKAVQELSRKADELEARISRLESLLVKGEDYSADTRTNTTDHHQRH